jgi:hypothetical protein
MLHEMGMEIILEKSEVNSLGISWVVIRPVDDIIAGLVMTDDDAAIRRSQFLSDGIPDE